MTFKAACLQLNSGSDISSNIVKIDNMIRKAAAKGADIVFTPENSCHMVSDIKSKIKDCPKQNEHQAVSHYSQLAKELGKYIYIGSLAIKLDNEKLANRSFLFSPKGEILKTYDKIHLFEVSLDTGEKHREADNYQAGSKAVIAKTPLANFGMTICYDIRFPHLYRFLAKAGANILVIPAAFTVPTGKAHWEILLRARAIENSCYVIAPAQTGTHEGSRKTYGHSMIINPWGEIMANAGEGEKIIYADIDIEQVDKIRSSLNSMNQDRDF